METFNVWALAIPKLETHDAAWLNGLGVDIKLGILSSKTYSSGRLVSEVCIGHQIEITTTCEKQETMLKLKYGDNLVPKIGIKT